MKCQIPEISWHNRDPVLSIDIQPKNANEKDPKTRLASGGTDSHVLIWYLQTTENGVISLECAADLARHQRAVNVVRWSPNGEFLASGDDESVIFIWKLKGETEAMNICDNTNDQDKEIWIATKILRGHMEDIYDLAWSPDSASLISGSVDNTARLWNVQLNSKSYAVLQEHQGFVQGVAWDPKNRYLATLSTDRSMRVYNVSNQKMLAKSTKCSLPVPKTHALSGETVRLFHDDTLQTFFRRLCFSPDGSLIVAPSGVMEGNNLPKPVHSTYIYTRNSWKTPAVVLPSPDQYTVAARFCPVLFELNQHDTEHPPVIPLPYRMIFAVATKSSVYLYDTQQRTPFAVISNIHYTRLTDLAWSEDGLCLIVSSTDGFCSIITFDDGELGVLYREKKSVTLNDTINTTSAEKKTDPKPIDIPTKPPLEIKPIIEAGDKILEILADKIVSVAERFSPPPVKIDKPVTPIAVRRHPRVQETDENKTESEKPVTTPPKSDYKTALTPKKKGATPIATRKTPRGKIISEPPRSSNVVNEVAVDAWPIDQPPPTVPSNPTVESKKNVQDLLMSRGESENTQQIRLVVDEDGCPKDQESQPMDVDSVVPEIAKVVVDTDAPAPTSATKTPKTPRRVEFRTISTPKSKKKLLE